MIRLLALVLVACAAPVRHAPPLVVVARHPGAIVRVESSSRPAPSTETAWAAQMRACSDNGGPVSGPLCCELYESCYWNPDATACVCR